MVCIHIVFLIQANSNQLISMCGPPRQFLPARKNGPDETPILEYSAPSSGRLCSSPHPATNQIEMIQVYFFCFHCNQMSMTYHFPYQISYAFKNAKQIIENKDLSLFSYF